MFTTTTNAPSNTKTTPTDPFSNLFPNMNSQPQTAAKATTPTANTANVNKPPPVRPPPMYNQPNYYSSTVPPPSTTTQASQPSFTTQKSASATGTAPKISKDQAFGGLDKLLDPTFNPKSNSPESQTLGGMRRKEDAKEMDPNKLKILEWTDGKKANIRALLCSLHKVIWEGETRWEQCGMHQLVSADDVKKMYRKAVLAIHPDKLTGHPHVELAKLIFVELNDSWAKFQQEGQQNLF